MVSIIIPVYQVSDYIERCLYSVMGQTYNDIECIIVDDATKDDSIEKCERLINANHNPNPNNGGGIRFKILHHEVNRGLSAARNTGTKAATGDWVFYLDSDDEISLDCIEQLMHIAQEHPDAEMVVGNTEMHHQDGHVTQIINQEIPNDYTTNQEIFTLYYQRKLHVYAWNILIRHSFLAQHGLFFKEGIIYEDHLWLFYVMKVLSKLHICKDVTYHYYLRPGSIVTSAEGYTVGTSYSIIYNEILHNLTPKGENAELGLFVERFCKHYLEHKTSIPAYKSLMKEYRRYARKYDNRGVSVKLALTCVMGLVPGGLKVLHSLRKLKS